jgi:hypothetical protein
VRLMQNATQNASLLYKSTSSGSKAKLPPRCVVQTIETDRWSPSISRVNSSSKVGYFGGSFEIHEA